MPAALLVIGVTGGQACWCYAEEFMCAIGLRDSHFFRGFSYLEAKGLFLAVTYDQSKITCHR